MLLEVFDWNQWQADPSILLVYQSKDPNNPQWIIFDTNDECKPENTIVIEFGRIVLCWLNQLNHQKTAYVNPIIILLASVFGCRQPNDAMTMNKEKQLWDKHYNDFVRFIKDKKSKSKKELCAFYSTYRYLAHYVFSHQNFEEKKDIPVDCRMASQILGHRIIDGTSYQIMLVYGWTNLYDLDLWELLFDESPKYKIKQCKKCNDFFRTSEANKCYCTDCQASSKEAYAEEYRNDPINKLHKKIMGKFNVNKKYSNEEGDRLMHKYINEFNYYKDIVYHGKSDRTRLDHYDDNIKTKEDLKNWLTQFEANI